MDDGQVLQATAKFMGEFDQKGSCSSIAFGASTATGLWIIFIVQLGSRLRPGYLHGEQGRPLSLHIAYKNLHRR
jgi:hypothetical protein